MDLPTTNGEPERLEGEDVGAIPAGWQTEIAKLAKTLRGMGVDVRVDAESRLEALAGAIARWNSMVNLVSRKDITRLITYHFCDSASLLPLVKPDRPLRVLDIGGSNGLPGLVLAAISPHVDLTISDSRLKRRGFLGEVCAGTPGAYAERGGADADGGRVTFEMARVDSPAFRTGNARSFDLIVARAVTRLKLLLKWCLPLLRPGGRLVAYKGSRSLDEVGDAEGYFFGHGGSRIWVVGSPLAESCNALRLFVIAERSAGSDAEVGQGSGCGSHSKRRLP